MPHLPLKEDNDMKVKILEKCFTGHGGNMMKGEEHDLPDRTAEKLIKRGYAEAASTPKAKAPKKSNRSVGLKKSATKLEKPESDE
jgi:hypothetical protein